MPRIVGISEEAYGGIVSVVLLVDDLDPDFPHKMKICFHKQAVQTRMFAYGCTAQEAVLSLVRECYMGHHKPKPQSSDMRDQWGGMDSRVGKTTIDRGLLSARRAIIPDELPPQQFHISGEEPQ